MGITASTEEVKKTNVSQLAGQLHEKDTNIRATEVIQEKTYEEFKKHMDKCMDSINNESPEKSLKDKLNYCMAVNKYLCSSSDHTLHQPIIDKLRSVGYEVECSPDTKDSFKQRCTIYWSR